MIKRKMFLLAEDFPIIYKPITNINFVRGIEILARHMPKDQENEKVQYYDQCTSGVLVMFGHNSWIKDELIRKELYSLGWSIDDDWAYDEEYLEDMTKEDIENFRNWDRRWEAFIGDDMND